MKMRINLTQKQLMKGQDSFGHVGSSFAKLKDKISDVIDKVRTRTKKSISRAVETLANFPSLTAQPVLVPVKATGKSRPAMREKTG